jgi:hypothetical protein
VARVAALERDMEKADRWMEDTGSKLHALELDTRPTVKAVGDHEGRIRGLETQQGRWLGAIGLLVAVLTIIGSILGSALARKFFGG